MKKFISMVMAAAMVVSLVPATAFAKGEVTATAKIVDAWEKADGFNGLISGGDVPEVQLKVTGVDYQTTDDGTYPEMDVTYTLDNADFFKNTTGTRYTVSELKGFFDVKDEDGHNQLGTWGNIAATYRYVQETDKNVVAAALLDNTAEYYKEDTGTTQLEIGTSPLDSIHTVGAVETPGTSEADALAAYVGTNGAGKTRAGEIAGNRVYVATQTFTANGTDSGTYNPGDVVVFADDLVTTEDDLYTRDEVLVEIATALLSTNCYKKVAATAEGEGVTGGRIAIKELKIEDDNEIKVTFAGKFEKDDVISFDLKSLMDKTSVGRKATVSVDSDMVTADDLVYASVLDEGIKVTLKKVADVAVEEKTELEKNLKIESVVGDFADNQKIELKLNSGFEFAKFDGTGVANANGFDFDEDEAWFYINGAGFDTVEIPAANIEIEAVSAKVGDVAKITVKAKEDSAVPGSFKATADAVEAAKVVADAVIMSVDEDDDVPVIYSGVNVANWGITDDSDHKALKVTLEESVAEALNTKKAFTLTLPEGVYVTDVDVTGSNDELDTNTNLEVAFKEAYKKGEQECFEFKRNAFNKTTKPFEFDFEMTLIAEPGFEGDVTLTLGGDAFEDEAEVVIAKFVSPYTVEAAQNDLIIDYRNTEVPTTVVVKEAEAGLWKKDEMNFIFGVDYMDFENDVTFTVDDKSDLEVKAIKGEDMGFKVTEESDDEAAVVTISDISLYMGRQLAAGAYDLDLWTEAGQKMLTTNKLFTTDEGEIAGEYYAADFIDLDYDGKWDDQYYTVKEGFVNIITAGRDQDDASFTKKVVVPVGENYIVAGEETVALDVPAYISAAGYTMLPVRAVAVALGINNNNVLWDQATKTVTILYGQRIITMVAGQKVVYVNGSAIPASASVEIKDGRTFLPMRDLAIALGVTDITWDAATKTAEHRQEKAAAKPFCAEKCFDQTLNGNK